MDFWFWFILFDLVAGGLFFLIFSGRQRQTNYNPNTINYSADMTEFWYYIPKAPRTVLEMLSRTNKRDPLAYTFNLDSGVILFYPQLTTAVGAAFRVELTAVRGGTELRLTKYGDYPKQDALALRQNEFWHKKLDAFPIPYRSPAETECEY